MPTSLRPLQWLFRVCAFLLFVTAFIVFFYLTFPFHRLTQRLVQAFEARSGCRVEVGDELVQIPLRFLWHAVHLECPIDLPLASETTVLQAAVLETLQADLALLPLLLTQRGEIAFQIQMAQNGGEIVGSLIAQPASSDFSFHIKNEGVINLNRLGLSGILNMKGEARWVGESLFGGSGSLAFTLNGVRMEVDTQSRTAKPSGWGAATAWLATFAGQDAFSFSTIQGETTWEDNRFSIGSLHAQGEEVELIGQEGTLMLQKPFSKSVVSMTLQIVLQGKLQQMAKLLLPKEGGKPLTLVLRGILSSPDIFINGKRPSLFLS